MIKDQKPSSLKLPSLRRNSSSLYPRANPGLPTSILLAYTLLTLLLTWPLPLHLTTAVPNDIGDPLLNAWILAWDAHALLTNPLNLFNANSYYPLPNTLAFSEHLLSTALLALPLQVFSREPVLAYNLSLLLTFPLSAFGMYLLTLRWLGRSPGGRAAAFLAGAIFAFAPYRFAAIAHLQLLTVQWLPLALLYLDKILAAPRQPQPTRQFTIQCEQGSPSPIPTSLLSSCLPCSWPSASPSPPPTPY